MEASPSRSDSFSHGWLRCKVWPAQSSFERLDVDGDADLGHSFNSSASFIDMDPAELFSMRWTSAGTEEEEEDFDFGLQPCAGAQYSPRQLAKELKNLDESPPEGIKVIVNDDDFTTIFADIEGPAGTPYENGIFRMKLLLSRDFPQSPPKGFFLTKIFHPNIATSGEICVNTLKKDWNPTLGLRHVLLVVRCLLIEPFPESALNEQAGKMLLENYEEYARHARLYTGIHALKPKNKPKSGAISESTTALNVDQSNTTISEKAPSVPTALCASAATKVPGTNSQDQNAPAEPALGSSAAPKKEGPVATKALVDKKKMDARKKSLKRL